MTRLKFLKALYVSGNRLRAMPERIGRLKSLETLLIEDNNLKELPSSFVDLKNLRFFLATRSRELLLASALLILLFLRRSAELLLPCLFLLSLANFLLRAAFQLEQRDGLHSRRVVMFLCLLH